MRQITATQRSDKSLRLHCCCDKAASVLLFCGYDMPPEFKQGLELRGGGGFLGSPGGFSSFLPKIRGAGYSYKTTELSFICRLSGSYMVHLQTVWSF